MLPVYDRPNFVLSHGKGSYVWDTDGNKYLDFSAGIAVNALGHADEGVVKVGCSPFPFSFLRFDFWTFVLFFRDRVSLFLCGIWIGKRFWLASSVNFFTSLGYASPINSCGESRIRRMALRPSGSLMVHFSTILWIIQTSAMLWVPHLAGIDFPTTETYFPMFRMVSISLEITYPWTISIHGVQ